ncbi:SPOR domain-containing protein [Spiribacter onubensis]|uniref:SPOR domain-containing protein n=1 Tax=Spiribacter onubensis TaxID=3122420 RepID=A0ABV3S648_9GAMM
MEQRFKQRLIGAVVLVALGVIFLPMLLSGPVERTRVDIELDMPAPPVVEEGPALPGEDMLNAPEPGRALADQPAPRDPGDVPEAAEPPSSIDIEPEPVAKAVADDEGMAEAAPVADADVLYVQVGAFASADNAESLASRLRDDGIALRVHEDDREGRLTYRVQVGPFVDAESAEHTAQRLADDHELPGFIVEP